MKNAAPFAVLALLLLAPSARAQPAPDPGPDHRYEVTLLFGASLLGVEADSTQPLALDSLGGLEDLLPPGTLRRLLPSAIRFQDRMGGSFLQGFQVGRRLGRRAWLEATFLLAPTHTRRRAASFRCPAEVCAFPQDFGDALSAEERVVAWHYGLGLAYELARGDVRPYLSVGAGAVTYDLPRGADTSFAFDVGAGARLGISDRMGAKIEVGDRIVLDHFASGQTEHDLQLRAGAVLRLP